MKLLQSFIGILVLFFTSYSLQAQSSASLKGKWETTYKLNGETGHVTYSFKDTKGKLQAYSISMKDDKGNEQKDNSLIMDKITFKDGKGTCTYMIKYEGKTYDIKAKLFLKNKNTLEVSYTYYGYSDKETWKRK